MVNGRFRAGIMVGMWTAVTIVGIALGLWGLHRLATWAEGRGWIYYRNPPRGSVSYGVSRVDAILRPEVEHVIELRDEERIVADVDESGEGFGPDTR
jgi:hypothetical protein